MLQRARVLFSYLIQSPMNDNYWRLSMMKLPEIKSFKFFIADSHRSFLSDQLLRVFRCFLPINRLFIRERWILIIIHRVFSNICIYSFLDPTMFTSLSWRKRNFNLPIQLQTTKFLNFLLLRFLRVLKCDKFYNKDSWRKHSRVNLRLITRHWN